MIKAWLIAAAGLLLSAAAPGRSPDTCAMTAQERSWVEKALAAADWVMEQRLRLPPEARPTVIVFNQQCRFESTPTGGRWSGAPHGGKIRLPGGATIDPGVTSFASRHDETGQRYFVMALPSIWEAANVIKPGDRHGVTGVFLHEYSHTRQMIALEPAFEAAAAIYKMPDDFTDDSVQKHFQADPAYVAVIEKEIDLLYRAADERDPAAAKALARQALALMEARQKRWFVGEDAKWKPYDDVFLTMEGFGQWVAYAWLSEPSGGGLTRLDARDKMRGSRRWWSQEQGLALFLVIDRFLPNWAAQAFAAQPVLGIDLLRRAVADARAGADAAESR